MAVVESRIECVVLAAGSSERLGQSKVLVNIGEDTLVGWIVRRLVTQGLSPVVVTRSEIEGEVVEATPSCEVLVNPNPDAGRTGTLQVGIANLDVVTGHGYRLLVVPVDRPGFSDSTLSRLVSSERTCCPMKDGRGGHPLVLSADDVDGIRTASPDVPLRNLVKPFRFEVGDPHLHLNIDASVDLIGLTDSLADL